MAAGWSTEETKALLGVWGDADIQTQLDGVARNRSIYQQIATALADLGYERTWQQCKTKIKNLTQRYRKVTIIASIVVVAILPLYWIVYNQFYAR